MQKRINGDELAGWNDPPEGFTTIAEDDVDGSYEFNIFAVVEDPEGRLWCAQDEGCSCPTPFDGLWWPENWAEIKTIKDIEHHLKCWDCYQGNESVKAKIRSAVVERLNARKTITY